MSNSSAFTIVRNPVDGVTPMKYSCTQLMADNQAYALRIEYYYDILYHSGITEEEAVKEGEAALLKSVAGNFGLVDGARCQIPPVQTLWLIEATSDPMDQSVNFNSCLTLVPRPNESCFVYKGIMEAHYLGAGDPLSLESYIQQNLDSVNLPPNIRISYLGSQLDTSLINTNVGRDNLNPSASKVEEPQTIDPGKPTFTFVGGLLVAGFIAAFLGLFFVLYRRRQKFLAAQDVEVALSKSDLDDMSPSRSQDTSGRRDRESSDNDEGVEIKDDGRHDEDEYPTNNYRFDLATSMKNDLFNVHGRAANHPRPYGVGIEETSESDADSWAQTDGTIGSLELHLEPITAEV